MTAATDGGEGLPVLARPQMLICSGFLAAALPASGVRLANPLAAAHDFGRFGKETRR